MFQLMREAGVVGDDFKVVTSRSHERSHCTLVHARRLRRKRGQQHRNPPACSRARVLLQHASACTGFLFACLLCSRVCVLVCVFARLLFARSSARVPPCWPPLPVCVRRCARCLFARGACLFLPVAADGLRAARAAHGLGGALFAAIAGGAGAGAAAAQGQWLCPNPNPPAECECARCVGATWGWQRGGWAAPPAAQLTHAPTPTLPPPAALLLPPLLLPPPPAALPPPSLRRPPIFLPSSLHLPSRRCSSAPRAAWKPSSARCVQVVRARRCFAGGRRCQQVSVHGVSTRA
jgi:hypothetical protein